MSHLTRRQAVAGFAVGLLAPVSAVEAGWRPRSSRRCRRKRNCDPCGCMECQTYGNKCAQLLIPSGKAFRVEAIVHARMIQRANVSIPPCNGGRLLASSGPIGPHQGWHRFYRSSGVPGGITLGLWAEHQQSNGYFVANAVRWRGPVFDEGNGWLSYELGTEDSGGSDYDDCIIKVFREK